MFNHEKKKEEKMLLMTKVFSTQKSKIPKVLNLRFYVPFLVKDLWL